MADPSNEVEIAFQDGRLVGLTINGEPWLPDDIVDLTVESDTPDIPGSHKVTVVRRHVLPMANVRVGYLDPEEGND